MCASVFGWCARAERKIDVGRRWDESTESTVVARNRVFILVSEIPISGKPSPSERILQATVYFLLLSVPSLTNEKEREMFLERMKA